MWLEWPDEVVDGGCADTCRLIVAAEARLTDSDEEFGPDVDDVVVVVVVAVLDDDDVVGGRLFVFSKSEERDETPLMCEELFAWIGKDCVVLC